MICLLYLSTTAEIVIGESKELIFEWKEDGSTPWKELEILKSNN